MKQHLGIACVVLLTMTFSGKGAEGAELTDSSKVKPATEDEQHYIMAATAVDWWRGGLSAGLVFSVLPQPLTEYPIPAPMLEFRGRFSLPLNLAIYGRVGSNIATNIGQLGAMWTLNLPVLSVGGGLSGFITYGNITYIDGFNVVHERLTFYPMATASLRLEKVTLTARVEAEVLAYRRSRLGDVEGDNGNDRKNQDVVGYTRYDRQLTGGAITLSIEQPFWKKTHILLGVTFAYSRTPYQAWFLYNTFDDRLFSTEFFAGFIL